MSDDDLERAAHYFEEASESIDNLELGDLNTGAIDELKGVQDTLGEWAREFENLAEVSE